MKLIFKITLFFMLISSVVFLIGAMITYNAMSTEIDKEECWFLEERLESVVGYLNHRKPDHQVVRDKMIITPLDSLTEETKPVFSDTLVTHAALGRIEPHSKLDVIRRVNGRAYKIILFDLIIEEDDIEDAVRISMTKTYLLLLGVTLILSLVASYIVFKPFQQTLAAIRDFSIKESGHKALPRSSTSEFKNLSRFVGEMMAKAQRDYQSLKEFSENASHEIQTPISIAQGKLELLMESANLKEEQMELISSAQHALQRLSKMSNSLSLLTKIKNKEFSDFKEVNLSHVVSHLIFDFKELVELKSISMCSEVESDVKVAGSETLLEIMITNLLNNSVRHNKYGGELSIWLTKNQLKVANTGTHHIENPEVFFQRFKKSSDNPDSSGLGLSIVKHICDEHGFELHYHVQDEHHELVVSWT